jgi:xylose isomerase
LLPTLGAGESLDDLRAESFDVEAAAARGYHFERLDQLAMDHLMAAF